MNDMHGQDHGWQERWEKAGVYDTVLDVPDSKKKYYCLDMFPYPSGAGLHVGHPEGYTATDIICRYKRMKGFEVLHPMGWDAFGLPAENYAIKTGVHPATSTHKNIATFKRQIRSLGFSYDWKNEIDTSDPSYYRWTQWLFLRLYERGLAYRKNANVNWCATCQTVLANEQVVDGRCERCKNVVTQRFLKQWFFRITDYAERLMADLDLVDWPDSIKAMQVNWIGKSEGATLHFAVDGLDKKIAVFTTRPDTLFGATYVVLAPEHELVSRVTIPVQHEAVQRYLERAATKTDIDRTSLDREKTGVFTGSYAVNPATHEKIPIWIADYVLSTYGTGAVMAVPAHDERDYAFARAHNLPIVEVVSGGDLTESAHTGPGVLLRSGSFTGMSNEEAKRAVTMSVGGKMTTTYRLRDWLVSRQRYWGAPIPIIHCDHCGEVPVPDEQLPVQLPSDVDFRPTGESPLVYSKSFHDVACPSCGVRGQGVRRESDTMDTFVDSSWYFLRYLSANDFSCPFDPTRVKKWLPVDLYVGGAEHAVLHLLYSRFITKFLVDERLIAFGCNGKPFDEPFATLRNQGLILAEDGRKMSKSLGNVINPDDVVQEYGADTLRLYEMFIGPLEDAKPWDTKSIQGVHRFIGKVLSTGARFVREGFPEEREESLRALHKLIDTVERDIERLRFNTVIAAFMSFLKEGHLHALSKESFFQFLIILSPFTPHTCEKLWARIHGYVDEEGNVQESWSRECSVTVQSWPKVDPAFLESDVRLIIVQVNGKVRGKFEAPAHSSEETLRERALAHDAVQQWVKGRTVQRVIIVPGRLVNIVV